MTFTDEAEAIASAILIAQSRFNRRHDPRRRQCRPGFFGYAAWRCENGVGTIEFAAIAGVLAMMILGILDFGMGILQQMQVANAARAGAEYALRSGYNSTNIQTAERNATNLASLQTGTPSQFCGCPDATSGITVATCASTCANGDTAGTYVSVSSSASYTTLFAWPGITNPMTLASSATVRLN